MSDPSQPRPPAAATPEPVETEIRFLLPAGAGPALLAHPLLRRARAAPARAQATTYFDTEDRAFLAEGAGLRVREAGGRAVQTLKLPALAGPFSRGEWEWALAEPRPDLSLLRETPLRHLAGRAVAPVFRTEVERRAFRLARGEALVELCVDTGRIRAGEREEPIREVELELRRGGMAELLAVAAALHAALPLRLGLESKAHRGWRLVTGAPAAPGRAEPPVAAPGASGAGAFRALSAALLAALLENLPAAAGGDADSVHRMRVAIRRLRSLLALFRPQLAAAEAARFGGMLRGLGQVLGEARDWDVFLAGTLEAAAEDGVAPEHLLALREAAGAARAAARARLAVALEGPGPARLALGLLAWAEDAGADSEAGAGDGLEAGAESLAAPIEALAGPMLDRALRRARRRGRGIRHRTPEELHELRKAMKRLRYALEFLAPLLKRRRLEAQLRGCKALQERLGAFNDACVAEALAARLAAPDGAPDSTTDPALAPAAEAVGAWAAARREAALDGLHAAWRGFRDAKRVRLRAG